MTAEVIPQHNTFAHPGLTVSRLGIGYLAAPILALTAGLQI